MNTDNGEYVEVDQTFVLLPRAACTEKQFFRKVKEEMKRRIREAERLKKKTKEKPRDPSENKVRMEGSGFFGTFLKVVGQSEDESDEESEPDNRLSDSSDNEEQSGKTNIQEQTENARSSWSATWKVPSRTNNVQEVSVREHFDRTNKQVNFDRTIKDARKSVNFHISSKQVNANSNYCGTYNTVSESEHFHGTEKHVSYGENFERTNHVKNVTETSNPANKDQANEGDNDSNADSDLAEIHDCIENLLVGSGFNMDESGEEDSEVNASFDKVAVNIQKEPEVIGSADEDSDVIEILDDEIEDLDYRKNNISAPNSKVIGWGTFCDNDGRAEKRKFSSTVSGWGTFANAEGVEEKREFRRFDTEIDES